MPFVIAAPELIASAASDLAGVRSLISEANAAAARLNHRGDGRGR